MSKNTAQKQKKAAARKTPMRWISFGVACLALIITSTNLWIVSTKKSSSLTETANIIHRDAFTQYAESQQKQQLLLILHLASLSKDPSVALDLYKMALNQARTPETIAIIKHKINTLKSHPLLKKAQINTALYNTLDQLVEESQAAFTKPKPIATPASQETKTHTSVWDKSKQTLSQFIHIERLPNRRLYDTTLAEEHLLTVRMQLELNLAQWGVINHRLDVYQSATKSMQTLASHAINPDFIKAVNALPKDIAPQTSKKEAA